MDTSSLQAAKKRSFNLPISFRSWSSARERQEAAKKADEMAGTTVEEAARVQKAAAWQWHTRGVAPKTGVDGRSNGGKSTVCNYSNVLQKKAVEPPLAESQRAATRFKAEASFTRPRSFGAPPTLSAPPGAAGPSTPLYDEVELSGLRSQMANFVERLQHQPSSKDNEQYSPAFGDHQTSKPPPFPSAPSVSIETKAPPVAVAAASSDHQLTTLPPSASPVAPTIPLHMRPFSALHRLFRKVVSGSIIKSTKKSPQVIVSSPAASSEPEVLFPEVNDDTTQYHYHHYIHHHHHHYHYAQSPDEQSAIIRSRRRHSESSGIRPRTPSLWEAESDEEVDEAEESPIEAYLARRRRHSDSFPRQRQPKKAGFDEDEEVKKECAKAALPMLFSRRYKSERFSPSIIPTMVSKEIVHELAAGRRDGFDEGLSGMKGRRRHSAEHYREETSLERAVEGGGKSAGGAYKLGVAAGGGTPVTPAFRRRHSESSEGPEAGQCEMGKRTPTPGRPCWQSPSARYYVDGVDRHIGVRAPAGH